MAGTPSTIFATMRIAVYIENFLEKFPQNDKDLIIQIMNRLAELNPQLEFIFITAKSSKEILVTEKNIKQIAVAPVTANTLIWKWWLNIRLPSLLKRYKAGVLICKTFCSLKIRIPQCLLIPDEIVVNKPQLKPRHKTFFKNYMPKSLQQARSILCFSNIARNELSKQFSIHANDIKLFPPAVEGIFRPLSDIERNKIKENLTNGHEFFVCHAEFQRHKDLIELLKAFSVFKKMQQSNMKLVLTGKFESYKKFKEDLKTYKYREAVLIKDTVSKEDLAPLLGAAYAFILLSQYNPFTARLLQGMRSGIPVIAAENEIVEEFAGKEILYFKEGEPSDLAVKMMYLYKDEDMRKNLIEKAGLVVAPYSIDNSAKLLWQSIEDALN